MSTPSTAPNNIVYFHYHTSPFARRVVWYLAFRKIAYAECIQPRIMPRPDLAALGVRYRKTPSMAIGRDIYVDSRAIIRRLEQLFPPSDEHPAFSSKETAGLAGLLNKLSIDVGLFRFAVQMIPPEAPMLQDSGFVKDRSEFFGRPWTAEMRAEGRPQGIVHMRQCFDILESLLVDGRKWIGGTEKPTLADLEGVWTIDWFIPGLQPPKEYFSEQIYPRVYDWRKRFNEDLEKAKASAPKPVTLEGADAIQAILSSDFTDKELSIDSADPIQLKEGTSVEVYPTDGGGFMDKNKDSGRLVKLTKDEVAIAVQSEQGDKDMHIHAPRWNFKIREAGGSRL